MHQETRVAQNLFDGTLWADNDKDRSVMHPTVVSGNTSLLPTTLTGCCGQTIELDWDSSVEKPPNTF